MIYHITSRTAWDLARQRGDSIYHGWRHARDARLANAAHRRATLDDADMHTRRGNPEGSKLPSSRARLEDRIHAANLPDVSEKFTLTRLAELPDGDALCHGDFHPLNLFLSDSGAIVIDWKMEDDIEKLGRADRK